MINLEEIQSRLDRGVASLTDTHGLLCEVERLRELLLNAGWPRESEGLATLALQYERAAVVAFLRDGSIYRVLDYADSIERGEHRKEKECQE
jgi:hypothetical protein